MHKIKKIMISIKTIKIKKNKKLKLKHNKKKKNRFKKKLKSNKIPFHLLNK